MSNARDKANIPALNFSSTGIDDNATSTAITIDSNENIGIGETSPTSHIHLKSGGNTTVRFQGNVGGSLSTLLLSHPSTADAGLQFNSNQLNMFSYSDIAFFPDQANISGSYPNNEKMRIRHTGNVGIGTSSPDGSDFGSGTGLVHLKDIGASNTGIKLEQGAGKSFWYQNATNTFFGSGSSHPLRIYTGQTERMRIDSSGNVGIGNTVASTINSANGTGNLVVGSGSGTEGITIYSGTTGEGTLQFADATTGVGTYVGQINYNHSSNFMSFGANGAERMRIDSSGNVLVNTTSNGTESNLNVGGQFGLSAGRGFVFEKQDGANGSGFTSVTLQFTTGANGRTCFIETMVGSSGYHLYHVSHRYRGDTPNVLVNQGNGPTISWSVSNSGSNTGSVYTYVVNFPSSTSHPYAKFKVSLGGYITTPITSTSLTFA
mgnify:CR=1 FL=1|jgi:hypothetical protein